MTRRAAALAAVIVLAVCARAAGAQPVIRSASAGHRVEVSVGAALGGPAPLGTSSADLVRPNGEPLSVFRTDVRFGLGAGGEAGVAAFLSRRVGVEASGSWLRQQIRTTISDDYEGAAPVTLTQPMYRLAVEGALVVMLAQDPKSGVFLRAGGGWMQEMTDGATLAETGATAAAGLGMKYWWRDRPVGRGARIGLRVEARLLARTRGLTFGSRTWQFGPTGMAGLVVGF
ncbi:MAG: hypothetical protein IT184_07125 [Acidobacteria bacterium]|nr:hypothetical protein [Acidobacteriota bacterium]